MPGLLDFLGLDQQPQQGGLLNQEQQGPDWRAILQRAGDFGQGLLQASGPSMSPVAPSLGQMLGAGAQAMQQGDQNRQVGAMRDMQAKAMGQQFQQNQMAMDATKRKQDANTRLAQVFAPTQAADASGQIGYSAPPMDAAAFLKDPRNFATMVEAGHDPLQLMQAMNKPDDGAILPEGATYIDKRTGKTITQGAPKKPEFERELDSLYPDQNDPRRIKIMEDYVKRKGQGPQTNVNVNLPATKQRIKSQEIIGEMYGDALKADFTAPVRLGKIDRLESLLDQTYTGGSGELNQTAKKSLKAAADSLGMTSSFLDGPIGAGEAAKAMANEMALQLRNPASGAGMPGAMSDPDREFLVSMIPGLSTTPEGRKMMFTTMRAVIQRERVVTQRMRDYASKHEGTLDEGFFNELSQWSDSNPLFPRPTSPDQAKGLKKGTVFLAPDNSVRVAP